ncbi:FliM/FliN family flagellar motor switch protein [Sphingomonas soli]|uniref:FliM/FliN family flagellar motor switch protein n=1 Tax=Sphingomonas soli TaxID=266127 RepID=UPI00082D6C92|nr:FliM/FliN family flagellar motor switch protein [Sphingomonas soli]
MVNASSEIAADRRERPRASAEHAPALGSVNPNPFGDLVTLQHLCARLAKGLKPVLEDVARRELRTWAEPLSVQRYADYRVERGGALVGWLPLAMGGARQRAQIVLDGELMLAMLDAFFGGDGEAPNPLPAEFTPAAEALAARIAQSFVSPLESAWEPLTRIAFRPEVPASIAQPFDMSGDDPVVVSRFGVAEGDDKPSFIDILYPVSALKPHTASLMVKVHDKPEEVEPQWRSGLTRAVMGVSLPVRSVLCEPSISLARLMELKAGDIIPVDFGTEVPVMVAHRRLGTGQVGTSNGRAAVRLSSLEPINPEDFR